MNEFKLLPHREVITSLIACSFCFGTLAYRIAMTPVDAGLLFVNTFIIVLGVTACRIVISLSLPIFFLYNLYLLITCILCWLSLNYAFVCYWGPLVLLLVTATGAKQWQMLKTDRIFRAVYIVICLAICIWGFNSMYYGMRVINTLRNIDGNTIDKILFYDLKEMIQLEKLPDEPRIEIDIRSGNLQRVMKAFKNTIPWSTHKNIPAQSYVTVIQSKGKTISWFILKIDEGFRAVFIHFTSRVRSYSVYGTYRNDSLYEILKREKDFN